MSEQLIAYCVKCREKREVSNAVAEWAPNGSPATRGQCGVCGTNMYRRGLTPAHDALEKPSPEAIAAARKAAKAKKPAKSKAKSKNKSAKSVRRSGKLVIVESPAKAKTIGKYLGSGYTVRSSVGHVRDLLRSRLSVDVDGNYEPEYRVPNDKRKVVKELIALSAKAKEIYLATDPDREGEAIAWHVMESAEMEPERTQRVVFHEITKKAVEEALQHPREIDMERVNAQQARRILDRLVGYKLSPLLWRKIRGRLSAGRVQSVALRLVVEREREIEAFVPQEYWSLEADLQQADKKGKKVPVFRSKWHRLNGEKLSLNGESDVKPHLAAMEAATWNVGKVKLGKRQRKPQAPFTTSTLQQEASRKLGFGTSKTMRIAQQLYEGVSLDGGEQVGLITYMRTDSLSVSKEAQEAARTYVTASYGKEYLPESAPVYKTRSKSAQEAHEAVRPTGVHRLPKQIKAHLTRDQQRLYQLIWSRFVASQMAPAIYDTVTADVFAGDADTPITKRPYHFRATGSTMFFAGFLKLYEESKPGDKPDDGGNPVPSDLSADDLIELLKLYPEQHFTQPPPRFSEASLVKALEENGVGRPSTYASIISTVISRGYVIREEKRLAPTEIGATVTDMLVEYFPEVMSVDFTADMEGKLDEIADGKREWPAVIDEFYKPFSDRLAYADEKLPKIDVNAEPEYVGRDCPTCGEGKLIYREGRYGKFIGCQRFPKCRHTEQVLVLTGVTCPRSGAELVEKKSRRGRTFYGCTRYPECEWTSWKLPIRTEGDQIIVQQTKDEVKATECELKDEAAVVVEEKESVAAD